MHLRLLQIEYTIYGALYLLVQTVILRFLLLTAAVAAVRLRRGVRLVAALFRLVTAIRTLAGRIAAALYTIIYNGVVFFRVLVHPKPFQRFQSRIAARSAFQIVVRMLFPQRLMGHGRMVVIVGRMMLLMVVELFGVCQTTQFALNARPFVILLVDGRVHIIYLIKM